MKLQQDQQAQDSETRKLHQQILKHQIDRSKIEEAIQAREIAQKDALMKYNLLQGTPGNELPSGPLPLPSGPGAMGNLQLEPTQAAPGAPPGIQPSIGPRQSVPPIQSFLQHPEVTVPSLTEGGQPFNVRPQTDAQMLRDYVIKQRAVNAVEVPGELMGKPPGSVLGVSSKLLPLIGTITSAAERGKQHEETLQQARDLATQNQQFLTGEHAKDRASRLAAAQVRSAGDQNKLEQQYRQLLVRNLSNRSGGLGLEDQKVNQAIHLRAIFDQYRDQKTGEYKIPGVLYNELALGLARLVSPTGQVGIELMRDLKQKTAVGDMSGVLAYLGVTDQGQLPTGSTQAAFKMMNDSIERQGEVAEQNRDTYIQQLRDLAPTDLNEERKGALEKAQLGNKFKKGVAAGGVQSRIVQRNKTTGIYRHSEDGGQTWQEGQ